DHVGLAGERGYGREIAERVVWKISRYRRDVRVRTGIDQERVAVGGRVGHQRRTRSAPATRMILDSDRSMPAIGKRSGERPRDEIGTAAGTERLDQQHTVRHVDEACQTHDAATRL